MERRELERRMYNAWYIMTEMRNAIYQLKTKEGYYFPYIVELIMLKEVEKQKMIYDETIQALKKKE